MTDPIPIVLFDGVCNLCNATVAFIIRWESKPVLRFANLQSKYANENLKRFSITPNYLESIILIEDNQVYFRSAAAIKILAYLKFPWPILKFIAIIPVPLRDGIYDWIAKNRYGWFGKKEQCAIPSPSIQSRFLS